MSDASHQDKLTHISQILLRLSQEGSDQDKAFRKKEGNNDTWWEQEKDTASGACIFDDEQVENLKAFESFVN